jgi:4-hydroxy-2-oxoheptanedioate aldolase
VSESPLESPLKAKLASGEPVFGTFIKSASPALVEIMGHTGFDYVLLDLEHSPVSIDHLEHLIRAADSAGIAPVVRVPAVLESAILHPLDKGAAGLLVPMVNTPEMAESVARFAKYAPAGARGIDIYARSARFGAIPKEKYFQQANQTTLISVQIEGRQGMDNVCAIADVDGVDVVYVGPYDLSASLGIPGQVDDSRVTDRVEQIVSDVSARGKAVGIYVDDVPTAKKYLDRGIRFITLCVDTTIFLRACEALHAELAKIDTTTA